MSRNKWYQTSTLVNRNILLFGSSYMKVWEINTSALFSVERAVDAARSGKMNERSIFSHLNKNLINAQNYWFELETVNN